MNKQWRLVICALALVGCDVPSEDDLASPPDHGDQALTDTVLTVKPDGTMEQTTISVTREQRRAELAAKASGAQPQAEGVATESATEQKSSALLRVNGNETRVSPRVCAGDDLWLYDNVGNRLCIASVYLGFNAADGIDLATVRYGSSCFTVGCTSFPTWNGKVVAIYPGYNKGRLFNGAGAFTKYFDDLRHGGHYEGVDPAATRYVYFYGETLH